MKKNQKILFVTIIAICFISGIAVDICINRENFGLTKTDMLGGAPKNAIGFCGLLWGGHGEYSTEGDDEIYFLNISGVEYPFYISELQIDEKIVPLVMAGHTVYAEYYRGVYDGDIIVVALMERHREGHIVFRFIDAYKKQSTMDYLESGIKNWIIDDEVILLG